MDYNTSRNKLVISEYGRNVQKMVEHALSLEDRDQRTRLSALIVNVMAQLNPSIRDMSDYKQKLWDHLHMISGFNLDVDCPYPIPSKEHLEKKPDTVAYHNNGIRFRHYGKNIENIIRTVSELEDGPKKDELIRMIANQLKKLYLTWNRESVTDEVIAAHLAELSEGKLILPEDVALVRSQDILQRQAGAASAASTNRQKKGGQRQGSKSQSSYYRSKRNKRN
jgi:hypothetical protein